jgi:16S rRNA (guanine527-N7)-methyltransferase
MTLGQALARGISALGLDLDATAQTKLSAYVALLEKWNRTHNLTAIRDLERMVTHHILDSLAVLPHLSQASSLRIIDIGSGGGLPGIPLAIARPAWHVALLDSSHKKAAFLRQAAAELPLTNVEVVTSRAEDYAPATRFDVAISRAFSDLARFSAAARHLVGSSGKLIAMKGVYPHEEMAHLPTTIRVIAVPALEVPGLEGARHLVIMEGGTA